VNSNSYRGDVEDDIVYPSALPFVLVHAACLAVIWSGVTWQAVAMGLVLYWLRIFAIGAGYHRYFSHRSYQPVEYSSFFWRFSLKRALKRASCGGRPSTVITTCIRIRRTTCIHPGTKVSFTATWDGSLPTTMRRLTF